MSVAEINQEKLNNALKEQLYFLNSSISLFAKHSTIDDTLTTEVEAKRIALAIRILIHDTPKSKSLLHLLHTKDKLNFIDSSSPDDGKLHSMTGMVGVRGINSNQYIGLVAKVNMGNALIATPLFQQHLKEWYSSYHKLSFDAWWNNVVMKIDGNSLTRKDLALSLVNKDGGAHYDPNLPSSYAHAKNSKLVLNVKGVYTEFERNIVYASVAQIGWELLNSIDLEY
jgi:hypothetical protein